jgi:hypothetical protein
LTTMIFQRSLGNGTSVVGGTDDEGGNEGVDDCGAVHGGRRRRKAKCRKSAAIGAERHGNVVTVELTEF